MFLFAIWSSIQLTGLSQNLSETAIEFPDFQLLRAKEDYRILSKKDRIDGFFNRIKYLSLGNNSFLTLGGNLRTEQQFLLNEEWSEGNNDVALFQRLMLHGDLHLGNKWRVFAQLKIG